MKSGTHSIADTASRASLLGDQLVADHLLSKLFRLVRAVEAVSS